MNKNRLRMSIYLCLLVPFLAATVTLRTLACLWEFNLYNGYFIDKSLINAANILLLIGVAALFSSAFVLKRPNLTTVFHTPATYISSGVTGVSLIFFAVRLFVKSGAFSDGKNDFLPFLLGCLAILSVVHFFLNAFISEEKNDIRAYFSIASIVFLALYAIYLYFNIELPINAPNKITDQMAFIFSAIFFLYEARISLGRQRWRAYFSFGLVAALLNAYSSIPSLIVYLKSGITLSNSIEESILCLALCAFIIARLVIVATRKERNAELSPSLAIISNYAAARSEAVEKETIRYADAFAIQLTIDDLLGAEDNPPPAAEESNGEIGDVTTPISESLDVEEFYDNDLELRGDNDAQIALPDEVFSVNIDNSVIDEEFYEKETMDGNQ